MDKQNEDPGRGLTGIWNGPVIFLESEYPPPIFAKELPKRFRRKRRRETRRNARRRRR